MFHISFARSCRSEELEGVCNALYCSCSLRGSLSHLYARKSSLALPSKNCAITGVCCVIVAEVYVTQLYYILSMCVNL